AEQPCERGVLAQRRERLHHLGSLRRRIDVGVEDVLPRTPRTRTRLEFRQVQMTLGERAEAAVERTRDVADSEDEGRLVRLAERRRVTRQRTEARVVVGI